MRRSHAAKSQKAGGSQLSFTGHSDEEEEDDYTPRRKYSIFSPSFRSSSNRKSVLELYSGGKDESNNTHNPRRRPASSSSSKKRSSTTGRHNNRKAATKPFRKTQQPPRKDEDIPSDDQFMMDDDDSAPPSRLLRSADKANCRAFSTDDDSERELFTDENSSTQQQQRPSQKRTPQETTPLESDDSSDNDDEIECLGSRPSQPNPHSSVSRTAYRYTLANEEEEQDDDSIGGDTQPATRRGHPPNYTHPSSTNNEDWLDDDEEEEIGGDTQLTRRWGAHSSNNDWTDDDDNEEIGGGDTQPIRRRSTQPYGSNTHRYASDMDLYDEEEVGGDTQPSSCRISTQPIRRGSTQPIRRGSTQPTRPRSTQPTKLGRQPKKRAPQSEDSGSESELEVPYAQGFDESQLQLKSELSDARKEPLRVGDVIMYFHPAGKFGDPEWKRIAQVLQINHDSETPLELDNNECLDLDCRVHRVKEYVKGKLYNHEGMLRPIRQFWYKSSKLTEMTGLDLQVAKFREIIERGKHQLDQGCNAEDSTTEPDSQEGEVDVDDESEDSSLFLQRASQALDRRASTLQEERHLDDVAIDDKRKPSRRHFSLGKYNTHRSSCSNSQRDFGGDKTNKRLVPASGRSARVMETNGRANSDNGSRNIGYEKQAGLNMSSRYSGDVGTPTYGTKNRAATKSNGQRAVQSSQDSNKLPSSVTVRKKKRKVVQEIETDSDNDDLPGRVLNNFSSTSGMAAGRDKSPLRGRNYGESMPRQATNRSSSSFPPRHPTKSRDSGRHDDSSSDDDDLLRSSSVFRTDKKPTSTVKNSSTARSVLLGSQPRIKSFLPPINKINENEDDTQVNLEEQREEFRSLVNSSSKSEKEQRLSQYSREDSPESSRASKEPQTEASKPQPTGDVRSSDSSDDATYLRRQRENRSQRRPTTTDSSDDATYLRRQRKKRSPRRPTTTDASVSSIECSQNSMLGVNKKPTSKKPQLELRFNARGSNL